MDDKEVEGSQHLMVGPALMLGLEGVCVVVDKAAKDTTGEGMAGEGTAGEGMTGEGTTGEGMAGVDTTDEDVTGKDTTTGKDWAGQDMASMGMGAIENIACGQVYVTGLLSTSFERLGIFGPRVLRFLEILRGCSGPGRPDY